MNGRSNPQLMKGDTQGSKLFPLQFDSEMGTFRSLQVFNEMMSEFYWLPGDHLKDSMYLIR